MSLLDSPPHSVNLFTPTTARDDGGGTAITFTAGQTAIPCSINTASASEQERFAARQVVVTHTIGIVPAMLTTGMTRGAKLVAADTSDSYHVKGFSLGRAYGGIPQLLYCYCEHLV